MGCNASIADAYAEEEYHPSNKISCTSDSVTNLTSIKDKGVEKPETSFNSSENALTDPGHNFNSDFIPPGSHFNTQRLSGISAAGEEIMMNNNVSARTQRARPRRERIEFGTDLDPGSYPGPRPLSLDPDQTPTSSFLNK